LRATTRKSLQRHPPEMSHDLSNENAWHDAEGIHIGYVR